MHRNMYVGLVYYYDASRLDWFFLLINSGVLGRRARKGRLIMTMNEEFSLVNEGVFKYLTADQLIEEIAYADEALETLSLERSIVGDCEDLDDLENRFRNYRRKFVELLGFDPSDSAEDDGGDYVPAEVSSSYSYDEVLEIPF